MRARHWARESQCELFAYYFLLLLSISSSPSLWISEDAASSDPADWRESWWVSGGGELVKRIFQKYFIGRISDLILFQRRVLTVRYGFMASWTGRFYVKISLAGMFDSLALWHLVWSQDFQNCASPSSRWCLPLRSSGKSLEISKGQIALER